VRRSVRRSGALSRTRGGLSEALSTALRGTQPRSAAYPQLRQWCRRRTSPKPCPQRVHALPSSHTGGASCRADACASPSLPNGPSTLAGRARAGGDVTAATTASHCPRPLRPTTVGMRRRARGAYSLSPDGRAPNRPTRTELISPAGPVRLAVCDELMSPDGPVRLAMCAASAAVEAGAARAADGPVTRADGSGGGGGAIGMPPSCAASAADEAAAETGAADGDDGDARGGSQGGRGAALPAPAAASVGLSKTVSPSVMEIQ
jgi:hypothetical protein